MFGVLISGPVKVLCNNQSVVKNTSKLESILNWKHSLIAYHTVRWSVAAGILQVGKVHTYVNITNAMMKQLTV